jgi:hypothetical protein
MKALVVRQVRELTEHVVATSVERICSRKRHCANARNESGFFLSIALQQVPHGGVVLSRSEITRCCSARDRHGIDR